MCSLSVVYVGDHGVDIKGTSPVVSAECVWQKRNSLMPITATPDTNRNSVRASSSGSSLDRWVVESQSGDEEQADSVRMAAEYVLHRLHECRRLHCIRRNAERAQRLSGLCLPDVPEAAAERAGAPEADPEAEPEAPPVAAVADTPT